MKKNYAFLILLFAITGATVLLLLIFNFQPVEKAGDGCRSSFSRPGSFENSCSFRIPEGAQTARLEWDVDLQSGSIDWTLIDAQGQQAYQGIVSHGSASDEVTFQRPAPGRWKLVISTHETQGAYAFRMR